MHAAALVSGRCVQMGLSGKLALQPIYTMSGGQKSRVSLALITWTKPQIMLLDEPTNHLDLVRCRIHLCILTGCIGLRGRTCVIRSLRAPGILLEESAFLTIKLFMLQETVSALIEALLDYTGGILVVSHDEHLITAVCDTLWVAGEGTVRQSKGDFQDYKQQCL